MKKTASLLYSSIGVAAMFVLLVAVGFLAGRFKHRFDVTAEKAFTLSPGTKAILAKLDTPVQIRFYCTQGQNEMPVFLKTYAQRIEDLLGEFKRTSKFIEIQKLDPQPDSDAEDSAKLDGVEGQMIQGLEGEKLYLGLSVSMLDQKQAISFLSPDRERLLEYDIARAISRVTTTDKPVVGVMSSLPMAGMPSNPMMMQMQQRGQDPWVLYSELKRDFTLKQVEMTADSIPDDIKVLLVVHPKNLSDATQYALDQFVLRGGKLIAFLDPQAVLDPTAGQMSMMGMGGNSSSNMEKLLKAWGVTFDSSKVVADINRVSRSRKGREPSVLTLTEEAINKDDVVTADADNLFMAFAGAFSGTPAQGLKETVLLKSTTDSQLVDPMMAQMSGEKVIEDFKSSGTEQALAIRLSGKFKTAFPEGKPAAEGADKKADASKNTGLKESKQETSVILIGDSDMIQDQLCVSEAPNPFGGGRLVMPANGNLAFAQGLVEQMSGDTNLIAVRSRAVRERPFTVVSRMQAQAESAYRSKIKDLEESLQDAQRQLSELQQKKEAGQQRFILSPEQQQALATFRKKESEVRKQLKEVRRSLRSDIDSLENRLEWIDIAGMPALVAVSGLALAVAKRKRVAAK